MNLKECLVSQLETARHYSDGLLQAFQTPQQWLLQVHPQANHPLWFAGHMATVDNFFISLIDPAQAKPLPGYQEKFGPGSHPTNRAEDYPDPQEVVACMRERRDTLLSILKSLPEEKLSTPTPAGTPSFLKDWESIFRMASWHEGIHSGQVAVAHRSLGHKPIVP